MTSLKTSIKTITNLSDTNCLEIHGASLGQSISLVMIGGVVAAILGPLLTIIARDVPGLTRFAGVYLVVAGLGILSAFNLALFLERSKSYSPSPDTRAIQRVSPTSRELMKRPDYRTAWFHLVIGSFVMLFLMTAAPSPLRTITR